MRNAVFLLGWLLTLMLLIPPASAAPPNIVLLYADDWRFDTLSCVAGSVAQTPHLDQLAQEGVRFTHACVTTSICGISRASLYTGQWMSRHGCRGFGAFQTPFDQTYPAQLRQQGYWLGHVGKWHNGVFPAEEFDFSRSYFGKHFYQEPDGTRLHVTQKNERDALEFLRSRPTDKPFCLNLCFFAPHAEDGHPRQYLPQPASEGLYQKVQIPAPVTGSEEYYRRLPPLLSQEENEGRVRWKKRFDTPEKYQHSMQDYLRLVTEVDAACGRVLAELARQQVLDNTLVIFTADNGYFHGEHGLADKWYPYQESIRVPLIIRDFRLPVAQRGQTNDALVLNVDLAPTILSAAGIAPPRAMQGQDLAPLYLAKEQPNWRTEFFYEHPTHKHVKFIPSSEALVRREIKYVLWPDDGTEELFDLRTDPHEADNLVADPQHADQLRALRARFQELKAAAK